MPDTDIPRREPVPEMLGLLLDRVLARYGGPIPAGETFRCEAGGFAFEIPGPGVPGFGTFSVEAGGLPVLMLTVTGGLVSLGSKPAEDCIRDEVLPALRGADDEEVTRG